MKTKNKQINPEVREFIDFAYAGYRDKFGEKMIIGAADAACIKRLLGSIDLERLKGYWEFFLNYGGSDFILKSITKDIKGFTGQINRIVQQAPRPQDKNAKKSKPMTAEEFRQAKARMFGQEEA